MEMFKDKTPYLLELVKRYPKHAWCGYQPPFNFDILDIMQSTGFRCSANLHQKYNVVWFHTPELNITSDFGYKIVLDELIRLLGEEGHLVLRFYENMSFVSPKIKSFLARKKELEVSIEYQYQDLQDTYREYVIVFHIKRLHLDAYQDKNWTFAMLTGGKKDSIVVKFLEGIQRNCKSNYEIIISGPKNKAYDKYNVKYLDLSAFRDNLYAEISKKKNAIANMATYSNLLIAHDRYVLADDFFSKFDQYGYDYDFLTIKQYYENGTEFPCYCALNTSPLSRSRTVKVDNYNQIVNTTYINGGLMIFKKHTLLTHKFNDLLFWDEMEDVELSNFFIQNSVIPRVNFLSSAITVGIDEKYTKNFIVVPGNRNITDVIRLDNNFNDDMNYSHYNNKIGFFRRVAKLIPRSFKKTRLYSRMCAFILNLIKTKSN